MGIFTGLVMEIGSVRSIDLAEVGANITFEAQMVLEGTRVGDSIAINGVDLTVTHIGPDLFITDVSMETMNRSTLAALRIGSRVNLERALTPVDRLGGHIVQGHVDDTGILISTLPEGISFRLRFSAPKALMRYIAMKGAIAVDGVSLTIAMIGKDWFEVVIIPHTWRETTLSELKVGGRVNIETDVLAKYVERLLLENDEGKGA